jgi:hypothetical protein
MSMYMSCTYKKYNMDTDGPSHLYHRMNQLDCTMKKFGGSVRKRLKRRAKKSRRGLKSIKSLHK